MGEKPTAFKFYYRDMKKNSALWILLCVLSASMTVYAHDGCKKMAQMYFSKDKHTFAKPEEAFVTHLDWKAKIVFEERVIKAVATYTIKNVSNATHILLDTKDLIIEEVYADGTPTPYQLGSPVDYLGQSLDIQITPSTQKISIRYRTKPEAEALQWLTKEQTLGKQHPFLFTQSQAILARTWLPCQDSPGIRITYDANVNVPKDLLALMSANINPTEKNFEGNYHFKQEKPIPAYLMALSVGDIGFKSVGSRTGVYAEHGMLAKAAYEFAEMEKMLLVAEELYGPYRWGRYDLIVLPPSFPFGGMENPCLTFATPTVVAGDRSLTSLVAHELAHSWSGNLVTNATWDDFWLNEGFTVYFENRIIEAVYGKSYAEMLALISYQDLLEEIEGMEKKADTKLKLDLTGRNPDDGLTAIAYDKGYYFLRHIEQTVGREKFDAFLRGYFDKFAFQTINTEQFVAHLRAELLDKVPNATNWIDINAWVYGEGIPKNCPKVVSEKINRAIEEAKAFTNGKKAHLIDIKSWSYQQYVLFLRNLPKKISQERIAALDNHMKLSSSGNSEVLFVWLSIVARNEYLSGFSKLEEFLLSVGRRKFIAPLYKLLAENERTLVFAKNVYAKARPNYHAVATQTIDQTLKWDAK